MFVCVICDGLLLSFPLLQFVVVVCLLCTSISGFY